MAGVRRLGGVSLDLAWVAAGRFDAFWETGLMPWDLAAGILLVKEAGGYVSEMDGGTDMINQGSVIAGNEYIQRALREAVNRPVPNKA